MKKGQNLSSLSEPKQEKAKIKHLFQVPKYFEESKFISLVLVNMNKWRAIIIESFLKQFGPTCWVYLCVSVSQLLKSTSARFYLLICPKIWVVILPHTYFKMSRKRSRKRDSPFAQMKIAVLAFPRKGKLKFYLFFKKDSEKINPWVVINYSYSVLPGKCSFRISSALQEAWLSPRTTTISPDQPVSLTKDLLWHLSRSFQ